MKLDDEKKQLLRELGHAINDTVLKSERIAAVIAKVHAVGLHIRLKIDGTIHLSQPTDEQPMFPNEGFLDSVHLRIDE